MAERLSKGVRSDMQIHREAVEIVIQTPAKLNLFFEVLGKRSDGYHEIETLMCPIGWYDTLCFARNGERRLGIGVPVWFGGRVRRNPQAGAPVTAAVLKKCRATARISSCERWTWFAGGRERNKVHGSG